MVAQLFQTNARRSIHGFLFGFRQVQQVMDRVARNGVKTRLFGGLATHTVVGGGSVWLGGMVTGDCVNGMVCEKSGPTSCSAIMHAVGLTVNGLARALNLSLMTFYILFMLHNIITEYQWWYSTTTIPYVHHI